MRSRRWRPLGIGTVALTAVALLAAAPATAASAGGPRISTVVSGLNSPRGVVVDRRGNIYVSESGVAGAGPAGLTMSGRVSRYNRGSSTPTWSTPFESVYATVDGATAPDVLGPEQLSSQGFGCAMHTGCPISLITSDSHDGVAALSGGAVQTTQAGHLFTLNRRTGEATDRADVGDQNYAFTNEHKDLFPSDFPDSNPFGVLVTRSHGKVRTFVADAGANTIDEVMGDGTTRVIAFIPNETAAPFRDATPTCMAQGPDGMLYVGTLDLIANFGAPGSSHIWKVDPNANFPTEPTMFASGLTTVTSCTIDDRGGFWATELFAPNPTGAPGDVVRVSMRNPTQIRHIGLGSLPLPIGIAVGPGHSIYVNVNSAGAPGTGAVMRVRT